MAVPHGDKAGNGQLSVFKFSHPRYFFAIN